MWVWRESLARQRGEEQTSPPPPTTAQSLQFQSSCWSKPLVLDSLDPDCGGKKQFFIVVHCESCLQTFYLSCLFAMKECTCDLFNTWESGGNMWPARCSAWLRGPESSPPGRRAGSWFWWNKNLLQNFLRYFSHQMSSRTVACQKRVNSGCITSS